MLHTFDKRAYPVNELQARSGLVLRCTTCHKNVAMEEVVKQQKAEKENQPYEGSCRS